jgi:hypothetical protein
VEIQASARAKASTTDTSPAPWLYRSDCIPSLHVSYKSTKIKQYFKEERALRTEPTINNAHGFGIGRLLKNLPAVRRERAKDCVSALLL